MKKIISLILVIMCVINSFTMAFGATENIVSKDSNLVSIDNKISLNALNKLKSNNIEVTLTNDNKVVLKNRDIKTIEKANEILMSINANSFYPGPWIELKNYSYITSKKFRAATEAVFLALLGAWYVDGVVLVATLAKSASFTFGTYYFANRAEENIYYSKQYFYRELTAGSFDSSGNFIGNYQIKKIQRTTLNSDGTGGQAYIQYENSSIITPSI